MSRKGERRAGSRASGRFSASDVHWRFRRLRDLLISSPSCCSLLANPAKGDHCSISHHNGTVSTVPLFCSRSFSCLVGLFLFQLTFSLGKAQGHAHHSSTCIVSVDSARCASDAVDEDQRTLRAVFVTKLGSATLIEGK